MSDGSVTTIQGTFLDREAVERLIEHLVQEHGIQRGDIFVQAQGEANTVGTQPSGADLNPAEGESTSLPLNGPILVSADLGENVMTKAEAAFREAGAEDVLIR